MKEHVTLSIKIALPAILTILLFVGTIFFVILPAMEESHLARKREMIRELTESAWSVLSMFEEQEKSGLTGRKEAQEKAIKLIRNLRYGPERKDYFWINDMHPRMVMHPYRSDLDGKDISDFKDPDDKRLFVAFVRKVQENGAGYVNYMWQWKDNPDLVVPKISYVKGFEPWQWVVGTGIYIEDVYKEIYHIKRNLTLICIAILFVVVTLSIYIISQGAKLENARRLAVKGIQSSEKKFKSITESAKDAIIIMDDNGNVSYWNDAAKKIFGYSHDEILGENLHTILGSRENLTVFAEAFPGFQKTGQGRVVGKTLELNATRKSGRSFPIELSVSAVHLDGKWNAIGIVRDITDRKVLEERFRQSQKMEAIGTLAGGIAHDFNNILTPILVHTEIALLDVPDTSTVRNNLKEIQNAGHRAKDLVKQILMFSRQTETQPVSIDLAPIVKESLKLIRASLPTTIEIRQRIQENLGYVLADPTQMQQVVMNLCTNAAHATKDMGSFLEVTLEPVDLDENTIKDTPFLTPGPFVMLKVSDTGSGIAPEVRAKIFDPFFTTKPVGEGTGMGLAMVHGIVQRHGGAITVDSKQGQGTTFKVYLPKVEQEVPVKAAIVESLPTGHEQILFVDDEETIAKMAQQMLRRLGYHIDSRTSPVEALAAFQDHPDKYDLVITDMTMPNMTGDGLAKNLMKIRPDIPIIICTGYSHQIDERKALAIGIKAFLMKPFIMRDVAETIRKVLDSSNG